MFKWIAALALCMAAQNVQAGEYHVVDTDRLTFEGKRITDDRDPFFPDKTDWFYKYDLYWDVRMFGRIFWENDIEGLSDYSQFREVGWHFTQGLYLYKEYFAAVHEHYSRHNLDHTNDSRFPVQDSYGLRINFIH